MTWKSWKMTRNAKIGPNWNPFRKSSFSLQLIEDDMEMMEDDLEIMEDDLEIMEDGLNIMEDDLKSMEDDQKCPEAQIKNVLGPALYRSCTSFEISDF
jgi:hypothetical protein